MNVSFFIQPKNRTSYVYCTDTLRQGLQKMKYYGYMAIPVLDEEEKYVGTITEGDFLWSICDFERREITEIKPRVLEKYKIGDLSFRRKYASVRIDVTMDELMEKVMNQNYVPVVDDRGIFIGIVTRKDVISYYVKSRDK